MVVTILLQIIVLQMNWKFDLIKMFEDQEKDETKIGSTLNKCFPAIQEFILQQRYSVQELKSKWPLLFTLSGFKLHYEALTKRRLCDVIKLFNSHRNGLYGYMQLIQYKYKNLQEVLKDIQSCKESNSSIEIFGTLFLLCTYFHEDIGFLYIKVRVKANS